MKNNEVNRIITITVLISILFVVTLAFAQVNFTSFSGVKTTLSLLTVLTAWWTFYFKIGWKIPYFNLMLYKKNIGGTWFGGYKSEDAEGGKFEGDISLVIVQDYLNIKVTSYTDKFKNTSYSEVLVSNENDVTELVYVYSQSEKNPFDPNIRKGTSELELIVGEDKHELSGKFWTSGKTLGSMDLKKISTKKIRSFNDAKKIYKE